MIRVNCASIPRELFESEFFGHIKGAFSGAISDRAGRFELADGGTLFLDEIGEIPLELQGKLLRVLQEQQFERVGESVTRHVDVRIIAATNRDLRSEVESHHFREDLYFRLNVFPIVSVPLRQRQEDIPILASHFLKLACSKIGKSELQFTQGDMDRMLSYPWPGNIRELINVIERAVILSQHQRLHLDFSISHQNRDSIQPPATQTATIQTEEELRQREVDNIIAALKQCNGRLFGHQGAAQALKSNQPHSLRASSDWGSTGTNISSDVISLPCIQKEIERGLSGAALKLKKEIFQTGFRTHLKSIDTPSLLRFRKLLQNANML